MEQVLTFLRKIKDTNNPFQDPTFSVIGIEIPFVSRNNIVRKVIIHHFEKFTYFSFNDDIYIGLYIFILILFNPYAKDNHCLIKIVYKESEESYKINSEDPITIFNDLIYKWNQKKFDIKYVYSDTKNGIKAKRVNMSNLFFIIDKYHPDDFFLDKELKRWNNNPL
jgi:formyltetrahydrofolate hydrolase